MFRMEQCTVLCLFLMHGVSGFTSFVAFTADRPCVCRIEWFDRMVCWYINFRPLSRVRIIECTEQWALNIHILNFTCCAHIYHFFHRELRWLVSEEMLINIYVDLFAHIHSFIEARMRRTQLLQYVASDIFFWRWHAHIKWADVNK